MPFTEEVVEDNAETPEVETFNALGVKDGEFKPIKDVYSPICFLDVRLDCEWVPFEDIGIRKFVQSVEINDCLECEERTGSIRMYDPDGSLIESELLSEGLEIRIGMGFLGDVRNFGSWVIKEVNPKIGPGELGLDISIQCLACFMDRNCEPARYENLTAGEIVKLIAEKYGLKGVVNDPGQNIPEWSQGLESDWSTMDKLSQAYGYYWTVIDDELHFRPPQAKEAKVTLVYWPKPVEKPFTAFEYGSLSEVSYSCKKDEECGESS